MKHNIIYSLLFVVLSAISFVCFIFIKDHSFIILGSWFSIMSAIYSTKPDETKGDIDADRIEKFCRKYARHLDWCEQRKSGRSSDCNCGFCVDRFNALYGIRGKNK